MATTRLLSDGELREITERSKRIWEMEHFCSLLDHPSGREVSIAFVPEGIMSFHDPKRKRIEIGVKGARDMFLIETEEMLVSAVRLLRIHEAGHLRYTAKEPYIWGVKRGAELILEYISGEVEKKPRRFRKDSDYEVFLREVLPEHGIFLSMNEVFSAVRFIVNSLEDGRIERILANRYSGFERLRVFFRGITWRNAPLSITAENSEEQPSLRLNIVLNEILSLATVQMDMPGFKKAFGKAPEGNLVKELMPLIYKGITASTTRKMVEEAALPICSRIAPVVFNAARYEAAKTGMPGWLEKVLADLIRAALDHMDDESTGVPERDAEEDDSEFNPTFPESDIEVTLDDETYDKLMEKMKEKGKDTGGIRVKREHPKEEAKEAQEEDSDAAEHRENGDEENSEEGHDTAPPEESGAPESKDTFESIGDKEAETEASGSGNGLMKDESGGSKAKSRKAAEELTEEDEDSLLKDLERQMDEAKDRLEAEARVSIDTVNEMSRTEKKQETFGEVKNSKGIPLTNEDVKDVCRWNFREIFRRYELKDRLPAELDAKGKTLHRKYELLARNRKKPVSRYRKEGKIDPRNLYRLGMNKTDVFMKDGKVNEFDGCAYLLIDNSGSMAGAKRMAACRAAAVQEEAFKGLFPFKIVAFDEQREIIHEVVKDWEERQVLNTCWNFALHGRQGSGNCDEHDIRIATKELLKRSDRKKLLIVLSDGMPDDMADTKKAIAEARKKGVAVFGIYFEQGKLTENSGAFFKEMYEKDYVICPTGEIEEHLSRLMEKFFRS